MMKRKAATVSFDIGERVARELENSLALNFSTCREIVDSPRSAWARSCPSATIAHSVKKDSLTLNLPLYREQEQASPEQVELWKATGWDKVIARFQVQDPEKCKPRCNPAFAEMRNPQPARGPWSARPLDATVSRSTTTACLWASSYRTIATTCSVAVGNPFFKLGQGLHSAAGIGPCRARAAVVNPDDDRNERTPFSILSAVGLKVLE